MYSICYTRHSTKIKGEKLVNFAKKHKNFANRHHTIFIYRTWNCVWANIFLYFLLIQFLIFLWLLDNCDISLRQENSFWTNKYRKVASSNTSHLEAHAGFFRLLMKGIFFLISNASQCARMDLNKRFLPKPMTTTGWKGTPKESKSWWIEILHSGSQ